MKKSFRILCAALAVVTCAVFAACSGGLIPEKITGEEQTWGRYTLLVPDSTVLQGGNVLDPNDPDVMKLCDKNNDFHYLMFNIFSLESCLNSIKGTKEVNANAEDITLDLDGTVWTGVKYDSLGTDGFQMYAQLGGEAVLVSGYFYGYDSALVKAVLGSLKLNPAGK